MKKLFIFAIICAFILTGCSDSDTNNYIKDMKKLKEINPDFYGWLKVSGTDIEYPVVQTQDNEYYLNYNFNKERSRRGSIFCDYRNDRDISNNRNIILYGRNMLDGSMFCPLVKEYVKEEIFQNGIIELTTEDAIYYYQVFSAREEDPTYNYRQTDFDSDEEYIDFLYTMKERSIFHKNIVLDEHSQIITLSTSINDIKRDIRFTIQGVLIDVVFTDN